MRDKFVSDLTRLTRQFQDLANRIKAKEQNLVAEVQNLSYSSMCFVHGDVPACLLTVSVCTQDNEENENTMARRRQTMNEYQVASFKEVDTAIINETNKGMLVCTFPTVSDSFSAS